MPRADFSHEHQCVDWDVLNTWAAERAIPEEKIKNLKHPLFGKQSSRQCNHNVHFGLMVVQDWRSRMAKGVNWELLRTTAPVLARTFEVYGNSLKLEV
jgi:hypothetical protein